MKIVFTGGGSGGHLFPIVAIAKALKELDTKHEVKLYYMGAKDPSGIITKENFKVYTIATGKLRRYFSLKNISDIFFNIPLGYFQSLFFLFFIRPNLVISKGGLGSVQVCLAAHHLGIPVVLHESDSVPGLSNQKIGRWAKKIFVSFPVTEYFDFKKTLITGNPIRRELLGASAEQARKAFGITSSKPVIVFLGGSQGAQPLNEFVLIILNDLLHDYEIIHVCGPKNYPVVQGQAKLIVHQDLIGSYHLLEQLNEEQMAYALSLALVVVSRAGSGSIFEIAAAGKPSILVPLPSAAGDHQSKNAYQYASTGTALVIEQENLTPNFFLGRLEYLLAEPDQRKKMSNQALTFAKPMAALTIAKELLLMGRT